MIWFLDLVRATAQPPLGEAWSPAQLAVLNPKSSLLRMEAPPETIWFLDFLWITTWSPLGAAWSLVLLQTRAWAWLVDLEVGLLPRLRVSLAYFGSLLALLLSLVVD